MREIHTFVTEHLYSVQVATYSGPRLELVQAADEDGARRIGEQLGEVIDVILIEEGVDIREEIEYAV